MALVLKDRVRETSTTTGTGSFTLGGTSTGFQSFSVIGDGNTTYYGIVNSVAGEWEVGIGTYTASGTVLSRDTILESSNGGSAVDFSAGTKDVFVTYPAEKSASTDTFASPPAIGSTTPAAATFTTLTATGQTSLGGVTDSESLRVLSVASATRYLTAQGSASGDATLFASGPSGSNVNLTFYSRGTGSVRFGTSGSITNEQFRVAHTASAVNYVQVTGAATGTGPTISAQGSDTNAWINFQTKGTGSYNFNTDGGTTRTAFQILRVSTSANWLTASPAAASASPSLAVAGSDTNIDLTLTPKGTGNVRFGTYTGTALAIAGYIEIKDAGGTIRKLAVVA